MMHPRRGAVRQKALFEPTPSIPIPQLPKQVQEELARGLLQWLQALVKAHGKEGGDE